MSHHSHGDTSYTSSTNHSNSTDASHCPVTGETKLSTKQKSRKPELEIYVPRARRLLDKKKNLQSSSSSDSKSKINSIANNVIEKQSCSPKSEVKPAGIITNSMNPDMDCCRIKVTSKNQTLLERDVPIVRDELLTHCNDEHEFRAYRDNNFSEKYRTNYDAVYLTENKRKTEHGSSSKIGTNESSLTECEAISYYVNHNERKSKGRQWREQQRIQRHETQPIPRRKDLQKFCDESKDDGSVLRNKTMDGSPNFEENLDSCYKTRSSESNRWIDTEKERMTARRQPIECESNRNARLDPASTNTNIKSNLDYRDDYQQSPLDACKKNLLLLNDYWEKQVSKSQQRGSMEYNRSARSKFGRNNSERVRQRNNSDFGESSCDWRIKGEECIRTRKDSEYNQQLEISGFVSEDCDRLALTDQQRKESQGNSSNEVQSSPTAFQSVKNEHVSCTPSNACNLQHDDTNMPENTDSANKLDRLIQDSKLEEVVLTCTYAARDTNLNTDSKTAIDKQLKAHPIGCEAHSALNTTDSSTSVVTSTDVKSVKQTERPKGWQTWIPVKDMTTIMSNSSSNPSMASHVASSTHKAHTDCKTPVFRAKSLEPYSTFSISPSGLDKTCEIARSSENLKVCPAVVLKQIHSVDTADFMVNAAPQKPCISSLFGFPSNSQFPNDYNLSYLENTIGNTECDKTFIGDICEDVPLTDSKRTFNDRLSISGLTNCVNHNDSLDVQKRGSFLNKHKPSLTDTQQLANVHYKNNTLSEDNYDSVIPDDVGTNNLLPFLVSNNHVTHLNKMVVPETTNRVHTNYISYGCDNIGMSVSTSNEFVPSSETLPPSIDSSSDVYNFPALASNFLPVDSIASSLSVTEDLKDIKHGVTETFTGLSSQTSTLSSISIPSHSADLDSVLPAENDQTNFGQPAHLITSGHLHENLESRVYDSLPERSNIKYVKSDAPYQLTMNHENGGWICPNAREQTEDLDFINLCDAIEPDVITHTSFDSLSNKACSSTTDTNNRLPTNMQPMDSCELEVLSDDDSWFNKFDDNGDCIDSDKLRELEHKVGKVKLVTPVNSTSLWSGDFGADEYGHVLEIYNFSRDLVTSDLMQALFKYQSRGVTIKWVDDTHALAVFDTTLLAEEALSSFYPNIKLRRLSEATEHSRLKAQSCIDYILPYKERPETSALTAHRMVAGALGVSPQITRQQRDEDKRKLREAREKRRLVKRNQESAWDGKYGRCAMDDV